VTELRQRVDETEGEDVVQLEELDGDEEAEPYRIGSEFEDV
jgi:hypothetical protein